MQVGMAGPHQFSMRLLDVGSARILGQAESRVGIDAHSWGLLHASDGLRPVGHQRLNYLSHGAVSAVPDPDQCEEGKFASGMQRDQRISQSGTSHPLALIVCPTHDVNEKASRSCQRKIPFKTSRRGHPETQRQIVPRRSLTKTIPRPRESQHRQRPKKRATIFSTMYQSERHPFETEITVQHRHHGCRTGTGLGSRGCHTLSISLFGGRRVARGQMGVTQSQTRTASVACSVVLPSNVSSEASASALVSCTNPSRWCAGP